MGNLRGFIILFAVFFCSISRANTTGDSTEVSLKEVLSFQNTNQGQSSLVSAKANESFYRNNPAFSPWLTEVQTSLEHRFNIYENLINGVTNGSDSTPLTGRVNQSTPYGLSLELRFEEQLGEPELRSGFTDHYVRGTLSFSLVNDFLGRNSRKINSSTNNLKNKIKENQEALQCLDISKKYIDTYALKRKLEVSLKNLEELQGLYKKVSRAARKGAISKDDESNMRVDINNLEARIMTTTAQLTDTSLDLQNTSGFDFTNKKLLPPGYLHAKNKKDQESKKLKSSESTSSLKHIDILNEELNLLKKQLKMAEIQDGKDISLIAGLEDLDRKQPLAGLSTKVNYEFVGVQASWRFGDNTNNNQVKRLKALVSIKTIELNNLKASDTIKLKTYAKDLLALTKKILSLKDVSLKSSRLEKNLLNKFKNGNIRYFEFLSARNQVVQLENSLIDTKTLLWKRNADLMFLSGNYSDLCNKGL